MEQRLAKASEDAQKLADKITASRKKAGTKIDKAVVEMLSELGMANAVFNVTLTPLTELSASGGDDIEFMFSANRAMKPQPAGKIASGGETSRVMLAIKALVAKSMRLPTVIFDEIDTGVSGSIADAMGRIINELSGQFQVVDITHLPQVASKGDTHFVVTKSDDKKGVETSIIKLSEEQRVTEIAKLLSCESATSAPL